MIDRFRQRLAATATAACLMAPGLLLAQEQQHPDRTSNQLLQIWQQMSAQHFLQLGGLNPEEATVLMSDQLVGHPLFWEEARYP